MPSSKDLSPLTKKPAFSIMPFFKDNIVLIASFLGVFLLVLLVIRPSLTNIFSTVDENKQLRQDYTSVNNYRSFLEEYTAYFSEIEENYFLLEHAVPQQDNVPILMTQIQNIASSSGVLVSTLQYSGGIKFGDSGAANLEGTKEAPSVSSSSYGRVRLSLSASSSLESLLSFTKNLENASRLVDIDSFRYTFDVENNTIDFNCGLVSYYIPEIPPAKEGGYQTNTSILRFNLGDPEMKTILERVAGLRRYTISNEQTTPEKIIPVFEEVNENVGDVESPVTTEEPIVTATPLPL